jgi:hypothetical protein
MRKKSCSIFIDNDLVCTIFVGRNKVRPSDLTWVLPLNNTASKWSQIEKLLARYNYESNTELPVKEVCSVFANIL